MKFYYNRIYCECAFPINIEPLARKATFKQEKYILKAQKDFN